MGGVIANAKELLTILKNGLTIKWVSNRQHNGSSVIGLIGHIGSGKTTVANYLVDNYGWSEVSFADPLKQVAMVFKFSENNIYGTQEQKENINKLWGISGREFMQKFGTEVCRDFIPVVMPTMKNIWVNIAKRSIERKLNEGHNVIVSDIRFSDELDMIRDIGGVIIKIVRPLKHNVNNSHASVDSIDALPFDIELHNTGYNKLCYDIDMIIRNAINE